MTAIIIAITAFAASLLTLFSGFGLGTILMPVIAIFFPITLAIALTAVVHGLNSLFKLALLWKYVHWRTVWIFGIPAIIATVPGAWLLTHLSELPVLHSYTLHGIEAHITPVGLSVGVLLFFFATVEWLSIFKKMDVNEKTLPLGGILSGFFGGLSGHQGAFRSAFLIHTSLDKNQFVACNAAIAVMIDITRLIVYGVTMTATMVNENAAVLTITTLAAFAGAVLGKKCLKKITIKSVQVIVVIGLYLTAIFMVTGIL